MGLLSFARRRRDQTPAAQRERPGSRPGARRDETPTGAAEPTRASGRRETRGDPFDATRGRGAARGETRRDPQRGATGAAAAPIQTRRDPLRPAPGLAACQRAMTRRDPSTRRHKTRPIGAAARDETTGEEPERDAPTSRRHGNEGGEPARGTRLSSRDETSPLVARFSYTGHPVLSGHRVLQDETTGRSFQSGTTGKSNRHGNDR